MKKKENFLQEIEFDEYLSEMVYIMDKSLIDKKLYTDNEFELSVAVEDTFTKGRRFLPSIRKAIFHKEHGKGVIIGQCVKKEGYYSPQISGSMYSGYEDYEPAFLDVKNTIRLWIVATNMNRTILVEKK
jgi:hypothetical protein